MQWVKENRWLIPTFLVLVSLAMAYRLLTLIEHIVAGGNLGKHHIPVVVHQRYLATVQSMHICEIYYTI